MKSHEIHPTTSDAELTDGQMKRFLRASGQYSWESELTRVLGELRIETPETTDTCESTIEDTRAKPAKLSEKAKYQPPERLDALHVARGLATIGPYRVQRELGRGAMGIVLLARDDKLDRDVAIKVLRPDRDNMTNRQRFVREARAAQVAHDHVVAVHAVDEPEHGLPYIVMNHVDGLSLSQQIARHGPLEPTQAALFIKQVAAGLHAAHRRGLVHRDVKPGNILIERATGRAKISDFGLVRVSEGERFTREEVVPGTPEYMSPEQFERPDEVDSRSDVYSLGVTLYETLTGETPFRGQPHMIANQVVKEDPAPPRSLNDAVPVDLQTICLKAMSNDPKRRYASAAEMGDDLARWLKGEPVKARPIGRFERMRTWVKRHPSITGLTALVIAVSLIGFCAVLHQWRRAEQNLTRFKEQVEATERMTQRADREQIAAQQARSQVISAVVSQQLLRNPSPSRKEATQQIVHSMMSTFESGLSDYQGDPQQRPELAGAHLAVAWAAWHLDDRDKALDHYSQAEAVFAQLAKEHPSDASYQQHLGTCWHNIGEVHAQQGKQLEAAEALERAIDIRQDLLESTPRNSAIHYRLDLGYTRIALAATYARTRPDAAAALLGQATDELFSFAMSDQLAVDPQFRWRRAEALGKLGFAWVSLKHPREAIAAYEHAAMGHHTEPAALEAVASWNAKAASLYGRLGEHGKAKQRWTRAQNLQKRVVGFFPNDPDLLAKLQRYQQKARQHNAIRAQSTIAIDRVTTAEVEPN